MSVPGSPRPDGPRGFGALLGSRTGIAFALGLVVCLSIVGTVVVMNLTRAPAGTPGQPTGTATPLAGAPRVAPTQAPLGSSQATNPAAEGQPTTVASEPSGPLGLLPQALTDLFAPGVVAAPASQSAPPQTGNNPPAATVFATPIPILVPGASPVPALPASDSTDAPGPAPEPVAGADSSGAPDASSAPGAPGIATPQPTASPGAIQAPGPAAAPASITPGTEAPPAATQRAAQGPSNPGTLFQGPQAVARSGGQPAAQSAAGSPPLPARPAAESARSQLTGGRAIVVPPQAPARKSGEVEVCTKPQYGEPCEHFGADVSDLAARLGTTLIGSIQLPPGQIAAVYSEPNLGGVCSVVSESNPQFNRNAASMAVGRGCKTAAGTPEPIHNLKPDEPFAGRIDPASQQDLFQFFGEKGQYVTLTMRRTSGNLDPYLYLSAGGRVDEDDDSGGDRDAEIRVPLPSTRIYTVNTASFAGRSVGDYTLTLRIGVQPADEPDQELLSGQIARGIINTIGDEDIFTFTAKSGDVAGVLLNPAGESTVTARFELDGPDGKCVALPNGAPGSLAPGNAACQFIGSPGISRPTMLLPSAGRYALRVRSNGSGVGAYRLTLLLTPRRAVTPGEPLVGRIDEPDAREVFVFNANRGQFVTVNVVRTSGDLRPGVTLYDPNLLSTLADRASNGVDALLENYLVSDSGQHTVRVTGGGGTGTYQLQLSVVARPPATEREVCTGRTISGRIDSSTQRDGYFFAGYPGLVEASVTREVGSNLSTSLELRDANGNEPFGFTSPNSGVWLLSEGKHTLTVAPAPGTTGNYDLFVLVERPIAPNQPAVGRMNCPDETYRYTFLGVAGQSARISVDRLDGNLSTIAELDTPSGQVFDFPSPGQGNSLLTTVLPETGRYFVYARYIGTGAYRVAIELSATPTPTRTATSAGTPTTTRTPTPTRTPAPAAPAGPALAATATTIFQPLTPSGAAQPQTPTPTPTPTSTTIAASPTSTTGPASSSAAVGSSAVNLSVTASPTPAAWATQPPPSRTPPPTMSPPATPTATAPPAPTVAPKLTAAPKQASSVQGARGAGPISA